MSVTKAIAAFKRGEMVIVCDDKSRENEGDICIAAELLTKEQICFMMQQARGLICLSLSKDIAERLQLPYQVLQNNSSFLTPFAPSLTLKSYVDAHATAEARLNTIHRLIAEDAEPEEFVSPGSVYPLIARPAGVVARDGQTEGSYDLARLAGLKPAAVICEILNEDGTMCRGDKLLEYAAQHNMAMTSVAAILEYRVRESTLLRRQDFGFKETAFGAAKTYIFHDDIEQKEHLVLVFGNIAKNKSVLTRIHSECLTGDIFSSERCDCGPQLVNL
jgi:3,4-dihydroxy 2-butanone 4-phosphate synthase/GTP cyclohydrolase II